MPYKVVQAKSDNRRPALPGEPPAPITIQEFSSGRVCHRPVSGYSLKVAFRLAARLAGWPRGLILEPVEHEVAGG